MGDARFYYYPDPNGTMETIDLPETSAAFPADRQEYHDTELSQSRRSDGRVFTAYHGGSVLVSVRCEAIQTQSLVDDLMAMTGHLKRGRAIGFALDCTRAWGSYTRTPVSRGSPNTGVVGNVWYEPSPTIAAGGRLVFETPPPEGYQETIIEDTGLTASTLALTHATQGPRFTYGGVVHVRHPDFWPVLVLPAGSSGRNILRSEGDRHWVLDMELYYNVGAALAVAQSRGIRQTTSARQYGLSIDGAIEEVDRAQTYQQGQDRNPRYSP